MGGDRAGTIFCLLRQESCSLLSYFLGKLFSENGSQEPCIPFKFDCSQAGRMDGPPFGVPFSLELRTWLTDGLTRIFKLDYINFRSTFSYGGERCRR